MMMYVKCVVIVVVVVQQFSFLIDVGCSHDVCHSSYQSTHHVHSEP